MTHMIATSASTRLALLGTILTAAFLSAYSGQQSQTSSEQSGKRSDMNIPVTQSAVIEIATFKLKQGVTADEFRPLDKAVEMQHVAKQPGFISRESAAGDNGEWLVVVHWRSVEDAEASMASFSSVKAAEQFMSKLDANTMSMKRYMSK